MHWIGMELITDGRIHVGSTKEFLLHLPLKRCGKAGILAVISHRPMKRFGDYCQAAVCVEHTSRTLLNQEEVVGVMTAPTGSCNRS